MTRRRPLGPPRGVRAVTALARAAARWGLAALFLARCPPPPGPRPLGDFEVPAARRCLTCPRPVGAGATCPGCARALSRGVES